jgi:cellulose synthase/poly-beta-1,6-N-acetylglucosamine synthase-like glycosyltransferase
MENIVICVPFTHGEEKNVENIIEKVKKEFFKNHYKIFLIGPSFTHKEKNLYFIKERKRKGKSFWINKIKNKKKCIFFLISGDVSPCNGFFIKALEHFDDKNTGMVCCRVIPSKLKNTVSRLFEIQWLLSEEISIMQPKSGEAIVFRSNLIKKFHTKIVTDEAYIESNVNRSGKKIIYDKDIKVRNVPPKLLKGFISQRIRYHIGHLQVYKETGYKVASLQYQLLLKSLLSFMKRHPRKIHLLLMFSFIEMISRIYASILFSTGSLPYKWELVFTSRRYK